MANLTKVYQEIDESRGMLCEGCESNQHLTHSHRVPRGRGKDLVTKKRNIDIYCLACHSHVESGKFWLLNNGAEVIRYILKHDPQGMSRVMKMGDKMVECGVSIKDQQYWTDFILKIIDDNENN